MLNMKELKKVVQLAVIGGSLFLAKGNTVYASSIVSIDGSSTVYPITEAVAEEFGITNHSVRVTIGVSGTGGGFKKFCRGEVDITNASRPIKAKEIALCKSANIDFIELPVAYDGLAVVVNPANNWATKITVSELKKMWEPAAQKKVTKWSQIRDGWPDKEIHLFGPGVDSGTFDYFTKAIVGKTQASRGDFTSSEDDNVLVKGVSADKYALGYFGLAYYKENQKRLKVLAIDNGLRSVIPSAETVEKGVYAPLSRPLYIYVSKKSLKRIEVKKFVDFYLKNSPVLVREVGYISLPLDIVTSVLKRYENRVIGSLYKGK